MRHAHAAGEGDDHERALTPQGVRAAIQAGRYLAAAHCDPQVALLSPAVRVTQTWQHIAGELSVSPAPRVEAEPQLYLADLDAMRSRLVSIPDTIDCALLVAHNPGVTELANYLTASGPSDLLDRLHRGFAPAAVASFAVSVSAWSDVSERCAELRGFWD